MNWIPDEQSANCKARYISDFFFQKHCAVRTFLLTQPPRSAVYVLDGDIVVAAPEVPLDRWLEGQHDVVFYERDWTCVFGDAPRFQSSKREQWSLEFFGG